MDRGIISYLWYIELTPSPPRQCKLWPVSLGCWHWSIFLTPGYHHTAWAAGHDLMVCVLQLAQGSLPPQPSGSTHRLLHWHGIEIVLILWGWEDLPHFSTPEYYLPELRHCVGSGSPTNSKTFPLTIFGPVIIIWNLVIGLITYIVQKPLLLLFSATTSTIILLLKMAIYWKSRNRSYRMQIWPWSPILSKIKRQYLWQTKSWNINVFEVALKGRVYI